MKEFEQIYKEYFPRVYSFLYGMCGNASLAEELTQESFYQAFVSFHRYNGSCELFTWLAAIAKNTYFKYLRRARSDEDIETVVIYADESESPEKAMESRVTSQMIKRAISELSDKQRDVTVLRLYAELPFSQIAALLGISEGTAKVLYCRARSRLRELLYELRTGSVRS